MTAPVLRIEGLRKHYGGVVAVDQVSFNVEAGTITALIGPNGCGKSTLIDCLSGFLPAQGGRWFLQAQEITGRAPWEIVKAGLSRTFQTVRVYPTLTVTENLLVALQARAVAPWTRNFFRTPALRRLEADSRQRVREVIDRVGLRAVADLPAGTLSYGQQKLIALGAAVVERPALLILDEPLAGVNPTLCRQIGELLAGLRDEGMTLLLVEHNMDFVMRMSDKVVVLDRGRLLVEGTPQAVRADPRVLEAYIGSPPRSLAKEAA
ncbi:ABC transporter ATP-binding protein [Variovorax sp. M-6]|uniref:ABC transporter ATP-binding protein n=1 Tax=Variovorax sp. M-6 TaxID=3233041 RepID=UPI003F9AA384